MVGQYFLLEYYYFVDLLNYASFLGNYQQALETYKTIHKRFPDNVECKCYYWKSEEKALLPSEFLLMY